MVCQAEIRVQGKVALRLVRKSAQYVARLKLIQSLLLAYKRSSDLHDRYLQSTIKLWPKMNNLLALIPCEKAPSQGLKLSERHLMTRDFEYQLLSRTKLHSRRPDPNLQLHDRPRLDEVFFSMIMSRPVRL